MNKERLRQLLPVMQAYVYNEKVGVGKPFHDWHVTDAPAWEDHCEYRIKPEPETVTLYRWPGGSWVFTTLALRKTWDLAVERGECEKKVFVEKVD